MRLVRALYTIPYVFGYTSMYLCELCIEMPNYTCAYCSILVKSANMATTITTNHDHHNFYSTYIIFGYRKRSKKYSRETNKENEWIYLISNVHGWLLVCLPNNQNNNNKQSETLCQKICDCLLENLKDVEFHDIQII